MGNKPSKKGLDKDTLDFLTKNTNFDREAIKVRIHCPPNLLAVCARTGIQDSRRTVLLAS